MDLLLGIVGDDTIRSGMSLGRLGKYVVAAGTLTRYRRGAPKRNGTGYRDRMVVRCGCKFVTIAMLLHPP